MDYYHNPNILKKLIFEYEEVSHKGAVRFFEKTALLDIIKYYNNEEAFEKAIEVCDFAMTQHVSSTEFLLYKSRILVELKEWGEALDCATNALTFSPGNVDLKLLQAEILITLGEFDDAYNILKKLYQSSREEEKLEALFLLAKIYEINAKFRKMFFALKKALQIDPSHPILLNKIWLAAEMAGLNQESIAFHLELIEITPYSFLVWYNLGQAYFCLEQYQDAGEAFEYSFTINNKFDIAFKDSAEAFIMAEDYTKALEVYHEFLEKSEADSDVLAKMGLCEEHLGNTLIAKDYYLQALDMNPSNSMAYFRLGEGHMLEEKWEEAIHYYNEAIEADADREEYLAAIAEAYFKNKNEKQAKKFFQKATEMAPELSQYWMQYATFLIKMGDSDEAFSILDEAQIYTVDTEVLYCKAACLFAVSKRKEALKTLTQAIKENASLLKSLFVLTPELEQDSEVKALIKQLTMNNL